MTFVVDTHIPYGNACDIEIRAGEDGYEVSFGPDPHGGPETLWFCVRIRRVSNDDSGLTEKSSRRNNTLSLTLKHSHNMLGGSDPSAMRPVIRYDGGAWRRLPEGERLSLSDGRENIRWSIMPPDDTLDVAYCYPYGAEDVLALIEATRGAIAPGEPYYRLDTIGVSQSARPLWRLSNRYGSLDAQDQQPGLYVMSRQHSGETPGSWVLDGFLRYMASLGDDAPLIWGVPLANIDGVEGGDYGKDNFPYDLNRAWGRPPMRHEISVYQWDMARWRDRCRPILGIDFHAPGACETSGVYCYVPDPDGDRAAYNAAMLWAERTSEALTPHYAAQPFARVARYASRWETPNFRAYGWSQLGVPVITYETPYAMAGEKVLTQSDYRQIGRRIAVGILSGIEGELTDAA
jgi:hypothetical protein